ncbi:hypothetical protein FISHEDRAFT_76865 [Fistulina hepatica ATCC 64428]|uniref:Zn(2)-C6 fungal-type domain-containing protein n=1 Tax=Fistulina hepatica ATCC 64428 TaxID=1128425 RepID=A0A0D7A5K5_9AGAR|nr:hypothetical protein FISHEDRAFT_76865 [Fistulina hepatica ATCC 64428]
MLAAYPTSSSHFPTSPVSFPMSSTSRAASRSSPTSSGAAARKGRACIPCRERKIKCDAGKPFCDQCLRYNRVEDCDYVDAQGHHKTQELEEEVSRAEARLRQLQDERQQRTGAISCQSSRLPPANPFQYGLDQPSPTLFPSNVLIPSLVSSSTGPPSSEPITPQIIQHMVVNFLPVSCEFGWFLDVTRFQETALLPMDHPDRPGNVLLSAACLWSLHLSPGPQTQVIHDRLLSDTVNLLAREVPLVERPYNIVHFIQAELLMCSFFFRNGKLTEGKYHLSKACSLALSSRLYKREIRQSEFMGTYVPSLAPPIDAIEQGDRIRCFWAVYGYDQVWAIALNAPTNFSNESDIDIPWPKDNYRSSVQSLFSSAGAPTLIQFLYYGHPEPIFSVAECVVKAFVLFGKSKDIMSRWKPGVGDEVPVAISDDFVRHDLLLREFKALLTPLGRMASRVSPSDLSPLLLAYSLVDGAIILLHGLFDTTPTHREIQTAAALDIVNLTQEIDVRQFTYLNPLIGVTVWSGAAHVLFGEIFRLRGSSSSPVETVGVEMMLRQRLDSLLEIMAYFARICPMMQFQLSKLEDMRSCI